jgi:outer membrane protein assembly factor BamB
VTGEVLALDAEDGDPLWTYQLGDASERWVYSSPLAWRDRLFVGMTPHFVSLDQGTGEVEWLREDLGTRDWIASYPSPAGFQDYLILAFYGQVLNLAVLAADTGETVWLLEEEKAHRTNSTPLVAPDGTVYIVGGKSHVRAFDVATGEMKWESSLGKTRCAASPALSDDRLFVPDGDGGLSALDASSGQVVWTWESQDGLGSFSPYVRGGKGALSSPVVTDRFVFFGSADGHLYGLDVGTGDEIWSYDIGMPTLSSPILSGDGLWTGSCDGMIHAFTTDSQEGT